MNVLSNVKIQSSGLLHVAEQSGLTELSKVVPSCMSLYNVKRQILGFILV